MSVSVEDRAFGVLVEGLRCAEALSTVQEIVRSAPRRLLDADGATFVLRDGGMCFYADEDALSPLWKGQRFPLTACISGWAMLHGETAVVPDVTRDTRIPLEAYLPTFVKSLLMVPVGGDKPVAAIGTYWARLYTPSTGEIAVLEALAAATAEALERVGTFDAPFLLPSIGIPRDETY